MAARTVFSLNLLLHCRLKNAKAFCLCQRDWLPIKGTSRIHNHAYKSKARKDAIDIETLAIPCAGSQDNAYKAMMDMVHAAEFISHEEAEQRGITINKAFEPEPIKFKISDLEPISEFISKNSSSSKYNGRVSFGIAYNVMQL